MKIQLFLRDVVNKQASVEKINFNYVDLACFIFAARLNNEAAALLRLYPFATHAIDTRPGDFTGSCGRK